MKYILPKEIVDKETIENIFSRNGDNTIALYLDETTMTAMMAVCFPDRPPAVRPVEDMIKELRAYVDGSGPEPNFNFMNPPIPQAPIDANDGEICTQTCVNGITVKLYFNRDKGLKVFFYREEKFLKCVYIGDTEMSADDYGLLIKSEGVSVSGDCYVSVAVCEKDIYGDSEGDMRPESRQISVIVHKDDTMTMYYVGSWGTGETQPYFVYSDERQGFTEFYHNENTGLLDDRFSGWWAAEPSEI